MFAYRRINPAFRSRNAVERILMTVLAASSAIAILTTIGIVFSVIFESLRFFALVPVKEFLFGLTWNPQFEGAERAGSGQMGLATYGSVPLFVGTFLISVVALSISVPVGLFSAIYLSEYASPRVRAVVKPLMELLAGVPTVVYGFFAALTVAPFIRSTGMSLGLDVASESALAAGLVMGIMIIPFVSSLSDDVINAVPQALRDAAYGLGSTRSETIRQVVLPAALPGVVASILLAVSRAVGETMIVVMAAGLAANLSLNPLDAVTTVTSQIVTILVGDQEFESAKTLSAFALALTLIVITLGLNFMALQIVKKYESSMSETTKGSISPKTAAERVEAGLAARRSREKRFRVYGRIAIGVALAFLVTLFVSIFSKGIPGFFQHYVTLEVTLDSAKLDPTGDLSVQSLYDGDARGVIRDALYEATGASGRSGRKAAGKLISAGAEQRLRNAVLDDPVHSGHHPADEIRGG